jgi:DNA-binding transcriptional ArsR family regulator
MARDTGPDTGRRVVTDVAALRALAHPERSAILKLLMSGRSRTATECAAVVGASPSACSYHLRELERFGFVERDDAAEGPVDRRTRRWRAAAVGFSLGPARQSDASPAERAVHAAVMGADLVENDRLAREFVARIDDLPAPWQDAATFATYELVLTPDELEGLGRAIDELLRPHRAGVKDGDESASRTVHIVFHAIPRMDDGR